MGVAQKQHGEIVMIDKILYMNRETGRSRDAKIN
jgi:hypothetical protein